MQLFLTSNIGGIKKEDGKRIVTYFSNENNFLDNLKKSIRDYKKFVLIASNPDDYWKNDMFLNLDIEALKLSGLEFNTYEVLDYRGKNNVEEILSSSSLIFLSGGDTLQQNKFFNDINLSYYLKDLDCCIVGISAGAINSASKVLNFSEDPENAPQPLILSGLGLTNINIEPHFEDKINDVVLKEYILKNSFNDLIYGIPDGSYVWNETFYGRFYRVYGGTIHINNTEKTYANK